MGGQSALQRQGAVNGRIVKMAQGLQQRCVLHRAPGDDAGMADALALDQADEIARLEHRRAQEQRR